jgi:hypothetical protein
MNKTPNVIQKQKWETFTYIGKETRTITKLFKRTNIRIAYITKNTIQDLILQPKIPNIDKYNKSGMYQLKCNSCQPSYIGQTGRNFKDRYKEHIRSIRTNKPNTKYAQHILDTQHAYGPVSNTMYILLPIERKGQLMNTWERFHIYKLSSNILELNNTYTDIYNPIFNPIQNHCNWKINTDTPQPFPHSIPPPQPNRITVSHSPRHSFCLLQLTNPQPHKVSNQLIQKREYTGNIICIIFDTHDINYG